MKPYVLTDIEGTTTSITFVHDVLFPFAAKHLPAFIESRQEDPAVIRCLEAVGETMTNEGGGGSTREDRIRTLLEWIRSDRKHPALKELQGMVWRHGYESGAFISDLYEDVKPSLEAWKQEGWTLGVYSSGSVEAQRLLFGHTEAGDLTPLFSHFFDTGVGGKKERSSYEEILSRIERPGRETWFLSDVPEELDAAATAGMNTIQLVRAGTTPCETHPTASDFLETDRLIRERTGK